jgi:DNA-binding response OmpR family regulator
MRETIVPKNPRPLSEAESKASLLVVDAQVKERSFAVENLTRKGYLVDEATSGGEALAQLENKSYDLVVLDVALPGTNGVEVMRRIRDAQPDLPIVVLTAHATVESAVAAVKLGVVDYLFKPCKTEDLALTISRALEEHTQRLRHQRLISLVGEAMNVLRQPETTEPLPLPSVSASPMLVTETLRVGTLVIDRQKRQATLNTHPPRTVELTEGELSVLIALMEKPNHVLSYNDLAKTALGYEGMDKWTVESVIRSTVFRLRHKIEPGPDAPCLIRTVRGRGYFFSPA